LKRKGPDSEGRSIPAIAASYLALIVFAIFALYPIAQIITIALRPSDQLLSTSLALIPEGATLANFRILLMDTLATLGRQFHLDCAGRDTHRCVAGIDCRVCTLAFSVSRTQHHVERSARHPNVPRHHAVIASLPDPDQSAPHQFIPRRDHYYAATALPFCIWQLKGDYYTIPISLDKSPVLMADDSGKSFYSSCSCWPPPSP
jgi:arabinogalactan oligomer / maltooligosaccharide transport system permease protein